MLRDEVYRLAAEALRNAFRHANASRIEVEIRYDEKYFRIANRDDGKGIDSDGSEWRWSRGTLRPARHERTRRSLWAGS